MKKIIASIFIITLLSIGALAQDNSNASLEAAMAKFRNSIAQKQTTVFLSFISPKEGLRIMNTIDQGDAGNADNPTLDMELSHAELAGDFKRKGELYRSIFTESQDSPNFHDSLSAYDDWRLGEDNMFMPADPEDEGTLLNSVYVKWKQVGSRWYVVEVGRMIS